MIYNGDANSQDLISDINFWCSTNNTTYPIEDKTRNFIFGLARASAKIMKADTSWKHVSSNAETIPIAVKDLVAGQDNYTLASKHVKILRVRVKGPDGVFRTLVGKDRKALTDDELNEEGTPEFNDKLGYSLILKPTPNYSSTGGLEIEYQPNSAEDVPTIDSTDWEVGFNSDFERLPGLYASEDYCTLFNPDRLPVIRAKIADLEADIEAYFASRDIDAEPEFGLKKTSRGVSLLG
jgi:hypothetical protein